MEQGSPPPQRTSSLRVLFYLILAAVGVSLFLELTGMVDVAGKREQDTIIDRPHGGDE